MLRLMNAGKTNCSIVAQKLATGSIARSRRSTTHNLLPDISQLTSARPLRQASRRRMNDCTCLASLAQGTVPRAIRNRPVTGGLLDPLLGCATNGLEVDPFVAAVVGGGGLPFPSPQRSSSASSLWPWSAAGGSGAGDNSSGAKQSHLRTPQRSVCGRSLAACLQPCCVGVALRRPPGAC